jgi:hypothetical protein
MTIRFQAAASAILAAGCAAFMACAAPSDLYSETGYMMRYGDDTRRAAQRNPGDVVIPRSARLPALVSLMTPAQMRSDRVVVADGAFVVPDAAAVSASQATPVEVDIDRLTAFLREQQGVGVVDVRIVNGRYAGADNEVRVRIVTSERTEVDALHDFALICAGVYGMDANGGVDVVEASAVDGALTPWLGLRTTMDAFNAYRRGDVDLAGWVKSLDMRQY